MIAMSFLPFTLLKPTKVSQIRTFRLRTYHLDDFRRFPEFLRVLRKLIFFFRRFNQPCVTFSVNLKNQPCVSCCWGFARFQIFLGLCCGLRHKSKFQATGILDPLFLRADQP